MKRKIEEYVCKTLHSDFNLTKLNAGNIPYIIAAQFELYAGAILGREIVFALSKSENTPLGYQRSQEVLRRETGKIVVLVIRQLSPMHIHRMVEKGIDFIVPGQRMYMPSVFIDLGGRSSAKAEGPIPPAAQFIVLYHLEVESLNGKDAKDIAAITGYSYLTVTRALKWISDNVMSLKNDGRRKLLAFPAYKETLSAFKPFLRNPVVRTIHTEDDLAGVGGVFAGEYALAEMTMLAPGGICKAVGKETKVLVEEDESAPGSIEIWMYPPQYLAKNGICDKISLILSLAGNEDERVQKELEKIKGEVQW